jgi:uncharacterized zinc-type alcohol dehydrogenase-like protein
MIESRGFVAFEAGDKLVPYNFRRREPRAHDIEIELQYCGICHTDIHMVDDDFGFSVFPMVPGHEMIGRVRRVGDSVTKFKPGDMAAVGCFVDSCRVCPPCESGLESYCEGFPTASFGAMERDGSGIIFGGFSNNYVVEDRFALKVPANLDPAKAAPLLCAGITTYSPLRHLRIGPGSKVGVVGVGGLGHLGIRLAKAMGASVVAITTTPEKCADALRLGADDAILSTDQAAVGRLAGSLDAILDTVSAEHPLDPLISMLGFEGTLCILGMVGGPSLVHTIGLCSQRRSIMGFAAGGLPETQEMLDFCGEHGVVADVEVIPISKVNEAYQRLRRNDVRYRFVLDLQELNRSPS